MLGIPETIEAQVAKMETAHSWLSPMLSLQGDRRDRMEAEVSAWIEKVAEAMYPEAERAGRIVREVAGLFLERKALKALREIHPMKTLAIPIPETLDEAVELGAAEVMYASPEERMAARGILELMDQGMLKP